VALVARTGWEAAVLCSEWTVVTCDNRGMVTNIDISNNQFSGPLPESMTLLIFLEVL
ncbi:unnamed protein product, partial [Closterium sp. Naga37s-1]